eukprot:UN04874
MATLHAKIREIQRINKKELEAGVSDKGSWHQEYKHSAYIFFKNIPFRMNEGDLIGMFSQYGEIVDCNLIRDHKNGQSKGFGFIAYEDQRSTVLAVDNFNGIKFVGRDLYVDHVKRYRKPRNYKKDKKDKETNEISAAGDIDEDDETYEQRRKKIWDYEKYDCGLPFGVVSNRTKERNEGQDKVNKRKREFERQLEQRRQWRDQQT